jgi:adenylate cyclase
MSMTRRDRRDWRVILWVNIASAVASLFFSFRIAGPNDPSWAVGLFGIANSLTVALPIVLFEVKSDRLESLRSLRRLPLLAFFAIKVVFYVAVILGGLVLVRWAAERWLPPLEMTQTGLRSAIMFAVGMSVTGNLFFEFGGLLGFATLRSLVTGRYVQPRAEQKTFLLIDMKDSTGMAERLGPIRFHELLNDFFRNVAEAALECRAEIHKYVGDEAILTWSDQRGLADGEALECAFIVRDLIEAHRERYLARYGAVPQFRAALHCGEIVAGEIGDVRREIAYVGDTLNVAARLLDAAKHVGHDVLVSDDLLKRTTLPEGVASQELPVLAVRGRAAALAIWALARGTAA